MKIRAPKTFSALAVLGRHWTATARAPRLHPRLVRGEDGLYYCHEIPEGLPRDEALGLTLAIRWAELDLKDEATRARILDEDCSPAERAQLQDALAGRSRSLVTKNDDASGWLVALPGEMATVHPTSTAVVVTRALLEVRRKVRPSPRPFAPRDPAAELLQLHLRAMEAELRGPTPIETIVPPVILSDLGRDWSGGYTPSRV